MTECAAFQGKAASAILRWSHATVGLITPWACINSTLHTRNRGFEDLVPQASARGQNSRAVETPLAGFLFHRLPAPYRRLDVTETIRALLWTAVKRRTIIRETTMLRTSSSGNTMTGPHGSNILSGHRLSAGKCRNGQISVACIAPRCLYVRPDQ